MLPQGAWVIVLYSDVTPWGGLKGIGQGPALRPGTSPVSQGSALGRMPRPCLGGSGPFRAPGPALAPLPWAEPMSP